MPDRLLAVLLGSVALATAGCAAETHAAGRLVVTGDPLVHTVQVLGRSVRGRPIKLVVSGDPDSPRRDLVVGCIHGNEPAGIAIARLLASSAAPRETSLLIVLDANPDGVAAGTRTNGHGVDLNRNFPWRWRREPPGGVHYAGPRPLSEPESRALARLIERVRPTVTIWFHQALRVVDGSGGNVALERRYAALVGLPFRRLPRYPGGATDWQNARFRHATAFVVELPATVSPRADRVYARAATELIAQ